MTGIARPGSPPLRVVAAPDPVRIRGGEVPSLDGPVGPFASLAGAPYQLGVDGRGRGPGLEPPGPPRPPGQTASRLPTALRRTWGLDILEARPPEVGR